MNVSNPQSESDSHVQKPGKWKMKISRIALMLGLVYAGLVGFLVVYEQDLVYPGSGPNRGDWSPEFAFEEVSFRSKDGTRINAWYLPKTDASETVLVCHGNAENVAQSSRHTGIRFRDCLNANVLVFDYRGYGKSEGEPIESGILEDAEAAFKWLQHRTGVANHEISLVGHSLGGGPAVHLASNFGAKAMFLQRTFGSLVEPAQHRFWFVPVSLLMKNRFPSAEKIKDCDFPLHQSHGDLDQLVPIWSGRKIFENSPTETKEFFVNKNKNHWDALPPAYWISVKEFMTQVNDRRLSNSHSRIDNQEN